MRLHAENPDLSFDELMDLAIRTGTVARKSDEPRYEYECRQCGDKMFVDQEQHDRLQFYRNNPNEVGTRTPKCGDCWVN
jgi:hypothetical protein